MKINLFLIKLIRCLVKEWMKNRENLKKLWNKNNNKKLITKIKIDLHIEKIIII